jgi:hypothetical protein
VTWAEFHGRSEKAASAADLAMRAGEWREAYDLYAQAAEAEELALGNLPSDKRRTLGITAVSAASLWLMARNTANAQRIAYTWLGGTVLPSFAVAQMRDLLQTIWGEEMRAASNVKFLPGDVTVSIAGGEILYGGAPLDLILRKVEEIRAVVVRTVEMKLGLPLRKNRPPAESTTGYFQPWLIQQPAGSYQFAVRVRQPDQQDFFDRALPLVSSVAMTALEILRASIEDPDGELVHTVPDPDYRNTFLKLVRNLAPTGKGFERLTVGSLTASAAPVVMVAAAREALNATIRRRTLTESQQAGSEPTIIRGILRGLSLNNDWLLLSVTTQDGELEEVRIHDVGESLDDVIGPMVNRPVIVNAFRKRGGVKLHLADIEPEE